MSAPRRDLSTRRNPGGEGPEIPAELSERELEIVVTRLADDLSYGEDASLFTGSGVDYAQSRPSVPGDPVRDMDWRVTARTGVHHLKEYEASRRVPVFLLVDTSGSMHCRSVPLSKHELAVVMAGALGLACLRRLSPVGVLGAGEQTLRFPPSLNRGRIFHWMHELRAARPGEATRLGVRLDQVGAVLRSRSLIVVLSDLHDPEAVPATRRLAQRHDCVVLQLEDPAERGRLRAGIVLGSEAETGRHFAAHSWSRWFRGSELPGARLRRAGIDHLLLATDRPFIPPLRRFLRDRGDRQRGPR